MAENAHPAVDPPALPSGSARHSTLVAILVVIAVSLVLTLPRVVEAVYFTWVKDGVVQQLASPDGAWEVRSIERDWGGAAGGSDGIFQARPLRPDKGSWRVVYTGSVGGFTWRDEKTIVVQESKAEQVTIDVPGTWRSAPPTFSTVANVCLVSAPIVLVVGTLAVVVIPALVRHRRRVRAEHDTLA